MKVYPAAFRYGPRVPLAIGVHEQLRAALPEIPKTALRHALGAYCASPAYLRAIVAGTTRIGLDGKPSGIVTPEQTQHAAEQLARIKARRKEIPLIGPMVQA